MAESKPNQVVAALSGVKAGDVARYVFMPGIVPRVRRFINEGAGSVAMLMALVFAAVRLLPPNHPYLNPVNRSRFGLRHVFGEAWSRLVFSREHIDQVLIFFALAGGFALLMLQFAYMLFTLLIPSAHAAPPPAGQFLGMFTTQNPSKDVALMMLDSVFGVPNMFNSCVSTSPGCGDGYATFTDFPTPFQKGLQALFQYYSLAMLVVAVLVILYYVLIVVGETAMTGTPFGRRFDHIWAPLRLIMAIGLLVPLNYGYNSGQYIVLLTARMASGFATNAWINFNGSILSPFPSQSITPTEPTVATYENGQPVYPAIVGSASANYGLIARPPTPDVTPLLEFITLVQACKVATETLYPGTNGTTENTATSARTIQPYLVAASKDATALTSSSTYDSALQYYSDSKVKDVVIVFGSLNTGAQTNATETSKVVPYCGEITIPTQTADASLTGVIYMSKSYFDLILAMYFNDKYKAFGILEGCLWLQPSPDTYGGTTGACDQAEATIGETGDYADPPDSWKQTRAVAENQTIILNANTAYKEMVDDTVTKVQQDMLDRGWGGAGLWYNQLSQWNGTYMGAVKGLPTVSKMPLVMEKVASQKGAHDQNTSAASAYDKNQSNKEPIDLGPAENDQQIAEELANVYDYWNTKSTTAPAQQTSGNPVIDTIHLLFGASLYDITQNDYVNPLVTLVALGNSLLDTALRNLLISTGSAAAGGFLSAQDDLRIKGLGKIASATSGFFMMLVTMTIGIGVTLYYVLPFMPFLYFYFAVGAWVRSIFEAMVGVPLWALAHLKINGQGLPTESAIAGYFLILEIFIRPILTVFGLLASVSIFSALARTLNNLFPLVTSNLTGFNCSHCAAGDTPTAFADFKRDSLDQFFFTILYTIVIYMMGTSCFKMIDQVPDGVLRWIGNNVSSFAQVGREDVGRNLGTHATEAVQILQQQAASGIQGTATGLGSLLGGGSGSNTPINVATQPPVPFVGPGK